MYGHLGGGTEGLEISVLLSIDKWIYSFHMALFFFVSGYLQMLSEKKGYSSEVIKKRLLSILGPYTVFSVVFWCFKKIFSGSISNPVSLNDLLLIGIIPLSDLWFLYALAVFYIIRVTLVRAKTNDISILILAIVLSLFSMSIKWDGLLSNTALPRICKYFCFYYGGAVFQRLDKNDFVNKRCFLISIVLFFAGIVGLLVSNDCLGVCKSVIQFAVACCNIGVFVISGMVLESKVLQFFGMKSLYVYLVHDYAVCAVVIISRGFLKSPFIMTSLATAGGILFSIIVIWICKRIKVFNLLFKPQLLLRHR